MGNSSSSCCCGDPELQFKHILYEIYPKKENFSSSLSEENSSSVYRHINDDVEDDDDDNSSKVANDDDDEEVKYNSITSADLEAQGPTNTSRFIDDDDNINNKNNQSILLKTITNLDDDEEEEQQRKSPMMMKKNNTKNDDHVILLSKIKIDGNILIDTLPPYIENAVVKSSNSLDIQFSEPLNSSVLDINNYSIITN